MQDTTLKELRGLRYLVAPPPLVRPLKELPEHNITHRVLSTGGGGGGKILPQTLQLPPPPPPQKFLPIKFN